MELSEIALAVGFIVTGLNWLLPKRTVEKLRLDKIQKFLGFLASTKGGISFNKKE